MHKSYILCKKKLASTSITSLKAAATLNNRKIILVNLLKYVVCC